ncbi:MAG: hypothetical protein NVS1B7_2320 [Candidatus Saccharimonadales bacterium]
MENIKLQVVERITQANNVLVTVSANPSVDQLSAAIGFTLLLNKMGKHGTAVFSGEVPSTIEFLEPEKTIEKTTDSLRDFIIALDKSKADKLRYKIEDSHVKIFITPYRTSISDKDLEFSQGDFNVDVVVALGVHDQNDLDQAITAHGRILHDATVITIGVTESSNLGSLNWVDSTASSLSEMLAILGDSLGQNLLDEQMATALLTGIVAETDRFSNAKTSAATMSVSAKLMQAGANQQLIATKLEPPMPPPVINEAPAANNSQSDVAEELPVQNIDTNVPSSTEAAVEPSLVDQPLIADHIELPEEPAPNVDGSLQISHTETTDAASENHTGTSSTDEVAATPEPPNLDQIHIDSQGTLKPAEEASAVTPDAPPNDFIADASSLVLEPPTMGGTLTANAQVQGLDPSTDPFSAPRAEQKILSHDVSAAPSADPVIDLPEPIEPEDSPLPEQILVAAPAEETAAVEQSLADLEKTVEAASSNDTPTTANVGDARDAVEGALDSLRTPKLEPISALNAQYLDLNLGHIDPLTGGDVTNPVVVPGVEPVAAPPESTQTTLAPSPLPLEGMQPEVKSEPIVFDPTAPPPVPPPMMPPLPSPSNTQQ